MKSVRKFKGLYLVFSLVTSWVHAQVNNVDQMILPGKQAIVADFVGEDAGASHTLGFFFLDIDTDKDGLPDFREVGDNDDLDGDGLINSVDPDDDNDGIPDNVDTEPVGVNSMPASYFFQGALAAANGLHINDYWQFVPNNIATEGDMAGYFEHPGAYLYVDNNSNQIPDLLEYASGSNVIPPFVLEKGYSSTNSVTSASFPGLLGSFTYSGSPGINDAERSHVTGATFYKLADDDNLTFTTGNYNSFSPYYQAGVIADVFGTRDGNLDYLIYGTDEPTSMLIPEEIGKKDARGVDQHKYRWFDRTIGDKREVVFFASVFWSAAGSQVNTFYSRTEFNPDAPSNANPISTTTGDDYGGSGRDNWFPRLQNTGDHDLLAEGNFGAGTTWADIADSPIDGSFPMALDPINQPWVDQYQNWVEDVRVVQYIDTKEWIDDLNVDPHGLIYGRYGHDMSSSAEGVILRSRSRKQPHFMIYQPVGQDIYVIGLEDLYFGVDKGFDDVVFTLTTLKGPHVTASKYAQYTPDQCDEQIDYRIVVRNTGLETATSVKVEDTPDANSNFMVGSVVTSRGAVVQGNVNGDTSVEVNTGSIPVGDSVIVTFSVTVNKALLGTVDSVLNQAVITGSNFSQVLSSDPQGEHHYDPTESQLTAIYDTTAPIFSICPEDITRFVTDESCSVNVTWPTPLANDNCGLESISSNFNSGNAFPLGETEVVVTAVDIVGNEGYCRFNVIVQDDIAPTYADCPDDINNIAAEPGKCAAVVTWDEPTATDNCGGVTISASHNPGDEFPVGTTRVTYEFEDGSGNKSNCSFDVSVEDSERPVFTDCPDTVRVDADFEKCKAAATWEPPTVDDNCGLDEVTSDYAPGDTFAVGITIVTYTARDLEGNTETCEIVVLVSDKEEPIITNCPINRSMTTDPGICSAIVTWDEPLFSDNCELDTVYSSHESGDAFPLGVTEVTYTAIDVSGNQKECKFSIFVADEGRPIFENCPEDFTYTNNARMCGALVYWEPPTVTDNCALSSVEANYSPGDELPIGETSVIYTATDEAGNSSVCMFRVTVVDDEGPVISGCPQNITVPNDPGVCGAVVSWEEPTAEDNCELQSLVSDFSPGMTFPVGSTKVTYTAEDIYGNVSKCEFYITVEDSETPAWQSCRTEAIVVPPDGGGCTAIVTWDEPVAEDNCGIDHYTSSHNSGDEFSVGTTTVQYIAYDIHGNVDTCSFLVTVVDLEAPVIANCPGDQEVLAEVGSCSTRVTWDAPDASDNCFLASFISSHDSGDEFPVGQTTVTYWAEDNNGNKDSCQFVITVKDEQDPVFLSCPENIIVNASGEECGATVSWETPEATDNCGIESLTSTSPNNSLFEIGTTEVIYTAVDASGNETRCSFTVTVQDKELPQVTCPENMQVVTDPESCEAIVNWNTPVVEDNCGIASIVSSHTSGTSFPIGVTLVEYLVTDVNGNEAKCQFAIEVTDEEKPIFANCPATMLIELSADECDTLLQWEEVIVTDNCELDSIRATHKSGGLFGLGTTTVTYYAVDKAGNESTCTFDIVVENESLANATLTCSSDTLLDNDPGICGSTLVPGTPTSNFLCAEAEVVLVSGVEEGEMFPIGITTNQYALQLNGNTLAECEVNITVVNDDQPDMAVTEDQFRYKHDPILLEGIELSVEDVYCQDLKVDIEALDGALTLPESLPLVWEGGTSNHMRRLSVSGTYEDIRAALEGLIYTKGGKLEEQSDTVYLHVQNDDQLSLKGQIEIVAYSSNFEAMNILTPNNDGKNDYWEIQDVEEYSHCELTILDEWGKVVYEAAPYSNDWDGMSNGKELPEGTYYYIFKGLDSELWKGTISLIRFK